MRIAISATHCTRPNYSRQSLAALAACEGIGDVTYYPHVEPGNEEVRALVGAWDASPCVPTCNPLRKGVNANTVAALDAAFAGGADFVMHCEDDILLAPDALAYFRWAAGAFADDATVLSVAGYNRLAAMPAWNTWHDVWSRRWTHVWGWGTWRDRWRAARAAIDPRSRYTWDILLNQFREHTELSEVYPALSRSQNIGLHSSVHPGAYSPAWYTENHVLKHWAGQVVVPAGAWRDCGPAAEAANDVAQRAQLRAAVLR